MRGFLTGQFKTIDDLATDDYRRMSPRFQGESFQKNLDLVKAIEDMAREKRCSSAQLALAWVLARGEDIVPIPGTKHRRLLEENHCASSTANEGRTRSHREGFPTGSSEWDALRCTTDGCFEPLARLYYGVPQTVRLLPVRLD